MFIKLTDVRKRYDGENILNKISFTAGSSEKIALIGKNGVGKTTLLRVIVGLENITSGSIKKDPAKMTIGYHQQVLVDEANTIKDFIISSIPAIGEIKKKLDDKFDINLLNEYEQKGGYRIESKINSTLGILGMSYLNEDSKIKDLSGGEKTRLQIAPIIIEKPNLLLLDEPTNHLDINGLEFLENYIKEYKGIIIIATHDEKLISDVATRVIEIDKGKIFDVKGGYDKFLQEKRLLREKEIYEYKENKREFDKLNTNLETFRDAEFNAENQRGITRKDNDKMGFNFMAEKAAKKFARRAEIINRKLQDFEKVDKPKEDWKIKLDIQGADARKIVIKMQNISKRFDSREIIKNFSYEFYSDGKVWLKGKNGSGKTTLLKIITGEIAIDEGQITLNPTLRIGYLSQDHLEIDVNKTIIKDFLDDFPINESMARTYLHKFLFKEDEVYREINTFSQGEKAKYAFAKMLFNKPNYLLLDEPTNYMDMESKDIIEKTLQEFKGGFILATHDRKVISEVKPDITINMEHFLL